MDTKLMIFDLDGTLLDTIGDLAACCDHVLAARGLPLHTYEEYCGFVGNGVMRLVERALPEELRTPETVAAVRADFVAYYTEHIDRFTRPYEGIPELLRELVQRGVRLAVASNKFQIGTEKLVRIYFPSIRFDAVFGQCHTFECVSYRMSQVQGLADSMFKRVLLYDVFFHLHRPADQLLEGGIINVRGIEIQ